MKNLLNYFLFFLALTFCGCNNLLDKKAFVNAVKNTDNGLRQNKEVDNLLLEVQFKPDEYIALINANGNIHNSTFKEELNSQKGMQYFDLTLGLNNGKDIIQLDPNNKELGQKRVYYFSYEMQKDIYVLQNGKKLPCVLYHFERSYNLKNSRSFLLGFEDPDFQSGESTLVIDSKVLSEKPIKIKFNKEKIPKLKT